MSVAGLRESPTSLVQIFSSRNGEKRTAEKQSCFESMHQLTYIKNITKWHEQENSRLLIGQTHAWFGLATLKSRVYSPTKVVSDTLWLGEGLEALPPHPSYSINAWCSIRCYLRKGSDRVGYQVSEWITAGISKSTDNMSNFMSSINSYSVSVLSHVFSNENVISIKSTRKSNQPDNSNAKNTNFFQQNFKGGTTAMYLPKSLPTK